jgi:hypothetical protein
MLTLHVPMLLALLGTALMAVVIFAPAPVAATVTTSFAPPPSPPPAEFWHPPSDTDLFPPFDTDLFPPLDSPAPDSVVPYAQWPALVDSSAAGCDAAARLALVDALVVVRAPWAKAILRRALDDEPDARVRDAIACGLTS